MTENLDVELSGGVWRALQRRRADTGESLDQLVDSLLSSALALDRHSLFQVSTSNALIQGIFGGTTTVADLKRHGDFGVGTFAGLDGEMIMLEGECFRAGPGGQLSVVADDEETPFALIARFHTDIDSNLTGPIDFAGMTEWLDGLRPSENVFVGIRGDGEFDLLSMRAICRARPSEGLLEATKHQSEFTREGISGTLVGFWSPEYSRAVSVPGYHLHFVSDDRSLGGHVFGLSAPDLRFSLHTESELHLAMPETEEFLTADLAGDHGDELDEAETRPRS